MTEPNSPENEREAESPSTDPLAQEFVHPTDFDYVPRPDFSGYEDGRPSPALPHREIAPHYYKNQLQDRIDLPARRIARQRPQASFFGAFKRYHFGKLPSLYPPGEVLSRTTSTFFQPVFLLHSLIFTLLAAIFVLQALIYMPSVIDDSYITFRFVDQFVKGNGWRYNADGPRVEGFTNFLWAVLLIPPHYLGFDLMMVSKIYGLISGVLTMAATWGLTRAIRQRDDLFNLVGPCFLATNSYFAHWAMMGLETLLQCALVVLTFYRFEVERRDSRTWLISPFLAFLAATTRIDSLYYMAPLGLYGWWMVALGRMRLKRLLLWGICAAVPFVIYHGWRLWYFGDWAPNTYYAKQRFITLRGHDAGLYQLWTYYFGVQEIELRKPLEKAVEMSRSPFEALGHRIDSLLYTIGLTKFPFLIWVNFWALALALSIIAASAGFLRNIGKGSGHHGRNSFLRRAHLPTVLCLVLFPWGLNLYYLYHTNGDWMPAFRFIQIAQPFIGVAAGVGFGVFVLLVKGKSRLLAFVGWFIPLLACLYLLAGTASTYLRIETVYVFGKGSVHPGLRKQAWWQPAQLLSNLNKGYTPPLDDVSNFLLLETVDDSAIFMSDIGQPLWYAEHMDLYDVDGLTDPYLAHAPSRRGNLPTVEEHFQRLLESKKKSTNDISTDDIEELMEKARKADFQAHLRRNADYVMEQEKPEYLLLFINHPTNDPSTGGHVYPEISNAVYRHPAMKNYEEIETISKIGNVYNHIYIRKDVDGTVSPKTKFKRLFRAIDRNPRLPNLVYLLYQQFLLHPEVLNEEGAKRVEEEVVRVIVDYPMDHPVRNLLRTLARSGDEQLVEQATNQILQSHHPTTEVYENLGAFMQESGNIDKAIELYRRGIEETTPGDLTLYSRLALLLERQGKWEEGLEVAREATRVDPSSFNAFSDRATIADRASRNQRMEPEKRLKIMKEALWAFREIVKMGRDNNDVRNDIKRLVKEVQQLEKEAKEEQRDFET